MTLSDASPSSLSGAGNIAGSSPLTLPYAADSKPCKRTALRGPRRPIPSDTPPGRCLEAHRRFGQIPHVPHFPSIPTREAFCSVWTGSSREGKDFLVGRRLVLRSPSRRLLAPPFLIRGRRDSVSAKGGPPLHLLDACRRRSFQWFSHFPSSLAVAPADFVKKAFPPVRRPPASVT